ncbi:formimidoylglutamate deiminase [Aliikangiella coralliicola]|uniref:Formimidoylglutamate deiminase n=1 Tax=Aliikangiella coralliicola TaxID=2592383 RepID=A0A545U4P5_9GAMM|nr:formimidoylglutamate deiminase [Aliikangiella coralliicola]TQV84447.1 formimidoylglutamate deiminase [Aliikangiella coralliicola]
MKLYAEMVLIGNQWQQNKTLSIGEQGTILSIDDGLLSGAEKVSGALVPGMVNCHSHAFQRAFAGFSEYRASQLDSFWSWRDIMYRFVAKMTPEDAHKVAKYLYLEMLKAGYTCVAEFHYLHHQVGGKFYDDPAEMSHQVINAAKETGLAITHLPVLYTYAGFGKQAPSEAQMRFIHQLDEYCQLLTEINSAYQQESTIGLGIAPHSLRAVSEEQLSEIVPFIRNINPGAPVHIHIAEQLQEVEDSLAFYGKRPVEWLLDNHSVDKNWCLIHATHLTDQEVANLSKSGAVAGICPTTEANLGDGIFPTKSFLEQGGKFAIGSDSHIAVNVADEIRTLEYGQRLTTHQRAVLTSQSCASVGQNLYCHAAKQGALTVNQNVGEIKVGNRADIVVLDRNHPSLYLKQDNFILDAAIFACAELPVNDVMVAGQWKIRNKNHHDEENIRLDYFEVMKKLTA